MIDLSEEEFGGLVAEVLGRLAEDEGAAHLWQWRPRPSCADEPFGQGRRNHLGALVGLVGLGSMPALLAACGCGDDPCSCADDPCSCADDPCAADSGSTDTGAADTSPADSGGADTGAADTGAADTGAADTGAADTGAADTGACADDPCACADDPCAA